MRCRPDRARAPAAMHCAAQDMLDVAHHVLTQLSPAPSQLYVIGYSYGACVAANSMQCLPQVSEAQQGPLCAAPHAHMAGCAAVQPDLSHHSAATWPADLRAPTRQAALTARAAPLQVAGYVGIGFPLGAAAAFALGARKHWALLADSQVPKLLIHGTRDSFSPLSTLRDVVARYHEASPPPGPLDLQIVDGADHFFEHQWDEVAARTMAWLQRLVDGQAGSGTA